MQIGLFFGSFNPIHNGHMAIAAVMLNNTEMEELWFVVSPQNPLKKSKSLLHHFDRLKMVELAIGDEHRMRVSDIEFNMPIPSYTIDTLSYLNEKYPKHDFAIIVGEDTVDTFPKWKNHEQLLENYKVYCYPRPNSKGSPLLRHPAISFVKAPLIDVSATYIREEIKKQHTIQFLVPPSVSDYILDKGLYL